MTQTDRARLELLEIRLKALETLAIQTSKACLKLQQLEVDRLEKQVEARS